MVDIDGLISYALQIFSHSIMFYQKPNKFLKLIANQEYEMMNLLH